MWLKDVDGLRAEIARIEEHLRSSILDEDTEDTLIRELRTAKDELRELERKLWTQLPR